MDPPASAYPLFSAVDEPSLPGADLRLASAPRRDVGWVLRWGASLLVFSHSAIVLISFAYGLGSELTLARAARAGALEATLPRATYQSVAAAIERRLGGLAPLPGGWTISVQQNGRPVRAAIQAVEGDRVSVTILLNKRAVLPHWLQKLPTWNGDATIEAQAERHMPGRSLGR